MLSRGYFRSTKTDRRVGLGYRTTHSLQRIQISAIGFSHFYVLFFFRVRTGYGRILLQYVEADQGWGGAIGFYISYMENIRILSLPVVISEENKLILIFFLSSRLLSILSNIVLSVLRHFTSQRDSNKVISNILIIISHNLKTKPKILQKEIFCLTWLKMAP